MCICTKGKQRELVSVLNTVACHEGQSGEKLYLFILIVIFLDRRQQKNNSELNDRKYFPNFIFIFCFRECIWMKVRRN
jgi:hypothetical protein